MARRFAFLWQNSEKGSWFNIRWRTDLFLFSRVAQRALVKVFLRDRARRGKSTAPTALMRYANRMHRTDPGLAILAYLAAGDACPTPHQGLGIAWMFVGGFKQGLKHLAPIERARPGATQGMAGMTAYRDNRFALAVGKNRLTSLLTSGIADLRAGP